MPRLSQILALLCALLSLAAVALAKDDGHDKDRTAITADYILVDTAYENKNADGATEFLADDWVQIADDDSKQVGSKKEQHGTLDKTLPLATTITAHTVVTNISFTKTGATVMYNNDLVITASVNGHSAVATDKSTMRDTWMKIGNTWQTKQTKVVVDRSTFKDTSPK